MNKEIFQPPNLETLERDIFFADNVIPYWDEVKLILNNHSRESGNIYDNLTTEEIISFGDKLLSGLYDKESLVLSRNSNGDLWYDILLGNSNKEVFSPVLELIKNQRFNVGVDFGTGTGNTLRSVAPYCKEIIGVDSSLNSLTIFEGQGIPKNARLILGDVSKELSIDTDSVDLVVSNGMIYYLSSEDTEKFIFEVHRILKEGGVFYTSTIYRETPFLPSNEGVKGIAIDLLGRYVTGNGHPTSLGLNDFHNLLQKFNFVTTNSCLLGDKIAFEYTLNYGSKN